MPAGPSELGFVYFVTAKFAGYTAYCHWAVTPQLKKQNTEVRIPAAWKAGAVRTIMGAIIGAIVGIGFWKMPMFSQRDFFATPAFYILLLPVRIGEWALLLATVYRRFTFSSNQRTALLSGGIVTSFALDFLGIVAAFVTPGGMWVC